MPERASTSCSDSPFWRRIERNRSPTTAPLSVIRAPLAPLAPHQSLFLFQKLPLSAAIVRALCTYLWLDCHAEWEPVPHWPGPGARRVVSTAAPAIAAVS